MAHCSKSNESKIVLFTLRRFQPQDLDVVLQLFYDTIHTISAKYYNPEQVDTWAPKIMDREKWLEKLESHITYVAELDGIIVGFGDITREGYIDHIYTHKNYQAKGIALAILNRLEEDARDLGITELTTEASITAKPLAERRGYRVIKEQRKVLRGVEFVNYLMCKKL
jgi:putative acetyltransferase